MRYVVSIGGASGSIYGVRLLQELKKAGHEVHLIVSSGAKKILELETPYTFNDLKKIADVVYRTMISVLVRQAARFLWTGWWSSRVA